ncbi:hypothetical protein KCP71_08220 [Salmonella enterica subsp. enterica]|nr:hypothetical protein KCP71_08220 [Salmonella enterica subsp. enterica]
MLWYRLMVTLPLPIRSRRGAQRQSDAPTAHLLSSAQRYCSPYPVDLQRTIASIWRKQFSCCPARRRSGAVRSAA